MTQSMDYSKWDALAAATDAEEAHQQELTRMKNRDQYLRDQQQRVAEYEAKQASINEKLNQSDNHSHDHSPDQHTDQPHTHTFSRRTRTCGCGFTNVEDLKRYQAEAAAQPQISIEKKNEMKMEALHAVREHGKILASNKQWNEAHAVYERGCLIISALFEATDEQQDEIDELELLFTLNMALCKQNLQDHHAVIDLCKQALQYDESTDQEPSISRIKAHNRIAQAYVNLGEYQLADQSINVVLSADPDNAIAKQVRRDRVKRANEDRQRKVKYEEKLREKLKSTSTD